MENVSDLDSNYVIIVPTAADIRKKRTV